MFADNFALMNLYHKQIEDAVVTKVTYYAAFTQSV